MNEKHIIGVLITLIMTKKKKLEDSKVQRGEKWSWDMNPDSLVPNPKLSSTL